MLTLLVFDESTYEKSLLILLNEVIYLNDCVILGKFLSNRVAVYLVPTSECFH